MTHPASPSALEVPVQSGLADAGMPAIRVEEPFSDTVLLCAKCAGKLGAEGKALRKAIKKQLKTRRGAEVRLEKTGCFSLCPRGGQVLATARKRSPRRLLVLAPGGGIEHALDYLLGTPEEPREPADD